MKKLQFLFVFLFFGLKIFGQASSQLINFWDNAYLINPASVNPKYLGEFTVADRNQWIGIDGAPQTFMAAATVSSDYYNSQIGTKVINDKIGYSNILDISLSYAYFIRFDWSRLVFGIAGNVSHYSFDATKVTALNQNDPNIFNAYTNKTLYNADFGLEYVGQTYKFGVVSNKLLGLFYNSEKKYLNNNSNYLYCMYRGQSKNLVNLGLGLAVINNPASTQVEINLTTFIRYDINDTDPLQIGVSMRTWRQFAAHAGVYIGDNIKLLYTYELSKGILGSYNGSSHEILLRYRLQRNKQWGHQRYFESRLFDY